MTVLSLRLPPSSFKRSFYFSISMRNESALQAAERVLARDGAEGPATRILRFARGTDTTPLGAQAHPFWEEVYVLEGALQDLTLGQTFAAGTIACRPPGMRHGPWVAPEGCLTFEVRYDTGPVKR